MYTCRNNQFSSAAQNITHNAKHVNTLIKLHIYWIICICNSRKHFEVVLLFVWWNPVLDVFQVKPLIWIESVIEKFSHSRVEIMVKVRYWSSVFLTTMATKYKTFYKYFMSFEISDLETIKNTSKAWKAQELAVVHNLFSLKDPFSIFEETVNPRLSDIFYGYLILY